MKNYSWGVIGEKFIDIEFENCAGDDWSRKRSWAAQ